MACRFFCSVGGSGKSKRKPSLYDDENNENEANQANQMHRTQSGKSEDEDKPGKSSLDAILAESGISPPGFQNFACMPKTKPKLKPTIDVTSDEPVVDDEAPLSIKPKPEAVAPPKITLFSAKPKPISPPHLKLTDGPPEPASDDTNEQAKDQEGSADDSNAMKKQVKPVAIADKPKITLFSAARSTGSRIYVPPTPSSSPSLSSTSREISPSPIRTFLSHLQEGNNATGKAVAARSSGIALDVSAQVEHEKTNADLKTTAQTVPVEEKTGTPDVEKKQMQGVQEDDTTKPAITPDTPLPAPTAALAVIRTETSTVVDAEPDQDVSEQSGEDGANAMEIEQTEVANEHEKEEKEKEEEEEEKGDGEEEKDEKDEMGVTSIAFTDEPVPADYVCRFTKVGSLSISYPSKSYCAFCIFFFSLQSCI